MKPKSLVLSKVIRTLRCGVTLPDFLVIGQQNILVFELKIETFFEIENWGECWEFISEKIIESPMSLQLLQSEIYGYFDAWLNSGLFVHGQEKYSEKNFLDMIEAISKVMNIGGSNICEWLPIVFDKNKQRRSKMSKNGKFRATKIMVPILSIGIWPLIKFIAKRIRRRRLDREARKDRERPYWYRGK